MKYEIAELKNGLRVLLVDAPGNTAATVQVWFRAGSALEDITDQGIAHFLEHMFFKGTKKRPGPKVAFDVEGFGGEINAFTSFDYTCYYINTPNTNLCDALEILLDMVANPLFLESELIPERGVVFEEFRQSIDNPGQYLFGMLQKNAFSKGYSHQILGREKTIKNFSRKQVLSFRNKHYHSKNTMLVIGGDLKKKQELLKEAQRFKLPIGKEAKFPPFKISKEKINVHTKDIKMAQMIIAIGAKGFESNDAAVEDLAMNCLGHGESSRFYKRFVLDTTLANGISASTMYFRDGGAHFIKVVFPPKNLEKIMDMLKEEIGAAINEGVENWELSKIKNQYLAGKIFEKETIEQFSFSLGHSFAQTGDIEGDNKFLERIKQTTLKKVNESFVQIFTRPICCELQLPKEEDTTLAKKILQQGFKSLLDLKKIKRDDLKTTCVATSKFDPQVKVFSIKKGIDLIYRKNVLAPTFALQAYIPGGLSDENDKNNGVYNLLAGVITKGYDNIDYDELRKELDDKSANISAFAGKNAYGLTMHALSENFKELVPHFFGSLLRPDIPQKYLENEKELTLRSLEAQQKDPIKICFQEVGKIIFKNHPYSMNMLGKKENIETLTKDELLKTHKKNIQENKIVLTYCGDIEAEELLNIIRPLITVDKKENKRSSVKNILRPKAENKHVHFDREQTQIFIGTSLGQMDKEEHVHIKMLTAHLSGQSSELFIDVRDKKGLCYSAQPIHFNALEGGYFGIYMASGHDKVDAAIDAIFNIWNRLKTKGLTSKEFGRIKKMTKGQTMLNVQTNEDYAGIYSVPYLQKEDLDQYHKKNEAIKNCSLEQFNQSIKDVLSRNLITVTVGPK